MTVKKGSAIVLSLLGCGLVVGMFSGFQFDPFGILMGFCAALFLQEVLGATAVLGIVLVLTSVLMLSTEK